MLLLSSWVCKSALHWGAEIRTCCYSFRQQARVSFPGVPAREFYSLGRFLKLLIMLKLVVCVRQARVMTYTSSLIMQCSVLYFVVFVGDVGVSRFGLCTYFSVGPACVSLVIGFFSPYLFCCSVIFYNLHSSDLFLLFYTCTVVPCGFSACRCAS